MAGRCFREAIAVDDNCAMAYWGLAYSSGIYYNKPWHRMQKDELAQKLKLTYETSRAALERRGHVTPVESMLIEALLARYQSPTPVDEAQYHRWDDDYAAEMRKVYAAFAGDDDVCALHAEALMTRTPWAWMQPARHALGALLLEQGHVDEARQVYLDDLGLSDTLVSTSQHRDNLWSLHGLVECLERQDRRQQAKHMRARLNLAKARADVPINASCACRLQRHCCDS